jgi:pilus assembly protein CpaE
MNTTQNILIAGPDPKLPAEVEAALAGATTERPILHTVSDFRQAIEAARSRRPDLALVEMTSDLRLLKSFSEEVAVCSPETMVAAVFRPDVFGHDVSESSVIIEAIRAGVRDFLRRPISSHDLKQLLDRLGERSQGPQRALGKIIAMVSNKGGVGKSTLSVNTACGLAKRRPGRVLLVDLSLQMGVCASMLDLEPKLTLVDAFRERERLDETLIRELATAHDCGLHLLAAPASAVEGAEIDDEMVSRVLTLARRAYDFVIVDTFPLVDRVNMAVLDLSDRVYIVLENVVPTLASGVKLIELLNSLGYDARRQRIVLNRYSTAAGNLKAADVAVQLGRDVDHVIPLDNKAILAANTGRPYALANLRFSSLGKSINRLIQEIDQLHGQSEPAIVPAQVVEEPPISNGAAHSKTIEPVIEPRAIEPRSRP